jgi:hypothetical protein
MTAVEELMQREIDRLLKVVEFAGYMAKPKACGPERNEDALEKKTC